MSRYLISGVAGFLGSNLALRILGQGNEVVGFDNFISGDPRNVNELHERYPESFDFTTADVRFPGNQITGRFDYVLNLACPASPKQYYKDRVLTMETCSIGADNMMKIALAHGARFFHTSTSEIYGDPLVHPQAEDYPGNVIADSDRSVYDEGKRYVEALVQAYRRQKGLNAGVVRLFNTYGPRMNPADGRVVSTFIIQALRGEPLTIEGDGSHTRSFAYVDDTVDGMMAMIHSDVQVPVNIGNPSEFTILDLAEMVIGLTGSKSEIVHVQEAEFDPKKRRPDISRAVELFGWSPVVSLAEGLELTTQWFKNLGVAV